MIVPSIWVLTGAKTGDNAQVLRAANAMGLDYSVKKIAVSPKFETAKPKVEASLHHIDIATSDRLAAPWPDLVITIGRRLSLVALWIKRQSAGGTRIALFNAPKGEAKAFDLLVVPAFYKTADGPRVCRIGLPLIGVDEARIAAARSAFADSLGQMNKPLHVLLLGGDMGKGKLDPRFAGDIVTRMRQSHAATGSIFVSTSRRTPPAVADAIAPQLTPSDRLFRWSAHAAENPYLGLLAHGDSFTITADSLSMLTEVARLGKPLAIAEAPGAGGLMDRLRKLSGMTGARDLNAAANYLYNGGYAARLGEPLRQPVAPPPDDTEKVAGRLKQLVLRDG